MTTKQKPTFFLNSTTAVLAQKLERKRKNCQNPFQTILRQKKKKKVAWTTTPLV